MDTDRHGSEMAMWVIYERPRPFPNHFVVRKLEVKNGEVRLGACRLADTLEEARGKVPPGLKNMGRLETDPPVIKEVWV